MASEPAPVRTRTGIKVHLAVAGSSRTFCGARVAARLTRIAPNATPCAGCGLPPTMTAAEMQRCFLPAKGDG